jgi:hypothetical protein
MPVSGFYDPQSNYGGTAFGLGQFPTTPIGNRYLEETPDASFARYLAQQGVDQFSGAGSWAQRQYPQVLTGYRAALGTNPFLPFQQYLSGLNLPQQYQQRTPIQRGINQAMVAPANRILPR